LIKANIKICFEGIFQWQWRWTGDGDGYDDIATVEDAGNPSNPRLLTEPACDAEPLKLKSSIYNQESMVITCTDGDGQFDEGDSSIVFIPAENHCLLLCNNYPSIQFFADWKHNTDPETPNIGERVWVYQLYNSKDDPIELCTEAKVSDCEVEANHVDNILKCWTPPPKLELTETLSTFFQSLFQ